MENKKPLWEYELQAFPRQRDSAFEEEERLLDERYLSLKKSACAMAKIVLEEQPNILSSIEKIMDGKHNTEQLIEMAFAVGPGDNGYGYYRFHLMLNIGRLQKGDYANFIYLAISYVPTPDNGYQWAIDEFHERDTSNFSLRVKFLDQLELLTKKETAVKELQRISRRTYATCVKTRSKNFALS